MKTPDKYLTIGQAAERCGVSTATLRFYEDKGLIRTERSPGNQRLFHRAVLRQISIVRVAQGLGFSLADIREALDTLPADRMPNKRDWQRLSRHWRAELQRRIDGMMKLRDQLDGCIGCGCLSLGNCALYNPSDKVASEGPGPRLLLSP